MKRKNKKIIIFLIVLIALSANFAYAESSIKFNVDFPKVPAPVPGGFFDLNCLEGLNTDLCDSTFQYEPSVGNIVLLIFSATVWLAGLIAFGVLLYAGFLYIFAGSAPANKSKAKEMFVNVTWGLGIILLSVVTLNLINPDIANLKTTEPEPVSVSNVEYIPFGTQPPMPEPLNTSGTYGCAWDPNGSPLVCIDGIKEYPPYPACATSFMNCTSGLPYILCEGITDERLCNEFKEVYCDLGETGGPYDWEHPPPVAQLIGDFAGCMGSCIARFPDSTTDEIQECANSCWDILNGGGDTDDGGNVSNCKENCLDTVPPGLEFECDGLPACSGGEGADGYNRLAPSSNGAYTIRNSDSSCGNIELIQVIQAVAQAWHQTHPDLPINVTDMNGGGDWNSGVCHDTHNQGVDVDIHVLGGVTEAGSSGSDNLTIELAKLFINTGMVTGIIHNNTRVYDTVNAYFNATQPGLTSWQGRPFMRYVVGHDSHFHVHVVGTPGSYNRSCSTDTPNYRYYPYGDACCERTSGLDQKCENTRYPYPPGHP